MTYPGRYAGRCPGPFTRAVERNAHAPTTGGWAFWSSRTEDLNYSVAVTTATSADSARRTFARHVEQYTGLPLRGMNGTVVSCLHSAQVTSDCARSGKPSLAFRADRQCGHRAGMLMSSFSRKKCCSPAVHVNGLLQSRQVNVLSRNSTKKPLHKSDTRRAPPRLSSRPTISNLDGLETGSVGDREQAVPTGSYSQ